MSYVMLTLQHSNRIIGRNDKKSTLKELRIQEIQEKTLLSLFADDILVYMNKNSKIQQGKN